MTNNCIFTVMLDRITDILQPKPILFHSSSQTISFLTAMSLVDGLRLQRGGRRWIALLPVDGCRRGCLLIYR
jgi:hypothetical protein